MAFFEIKNEDDEATIKVKREAERRYRIRLDHLKSVMEEHYPDSFKWETDGFALGEIARMELRLEDLDDVLQITPIGGDKWDQMCKEHKRLVTSVERHRGNMGLSHTIRRKSILAARKVAELKLEKERRQEPEEQLFLMAPHDDELAPHEDITE